MSACAANPVQVYLDYAATAPCDPRVVERMLGALGPDGVFANPSARSHGSGRAAHALIEQARAQVAGVLQCDAEEIVWTSGATEADNLALKGAAAFHGDRRRHIVTSRTEHKAVLDSCRRLQREGFEVQYLTPDGSGLISPTRVADAVRPDTLLVSIMQVNSETGVVQDIEAIGAAVDQAAGGRQVLLHVDAAQTVGRLPIRLRDSRIDLMSFSAHKSHGPKGIGALFVRRRPRVLLQALFDGGGQQQGLRPGTLPTHQIIGMAEAFMLAERLRESEHERLGQLRGQLWQGLQAVGGIYLNGHPEACVPGILNVTVDGVEGESLLLALRALALSSGSACNSASGQPSYVLRALGRSDQQAQSSLRISFGRFTTRTEIDFALALIARQVPRLRALGPAGPDKT